VAFKRVVERLLLAPRGSRPLVVERLQCGHENSFEVPRSWVDAKAFPVKTSKCRERLCRYCTEEWRALKPEPHQVRVSFVARDIVIKESYNLLTDIAMAFAEAEAEDLKNGRGVVDGGGGGGIS
jgi:hypothetical protein